MRYRVKITNIQFDVEVEEIEEKPPIEIPEETKPEVPEEIPPVEKPIVSEWENITADFYKDLETKELIELQAGHKYRVDHIKKTAINRNLRIVKTGTGANPILMIGIENFRSWIDKQDGVLFYLLNGAQILIEFIDVCSPPQLRLMQRFTPCFFESVQDDQAQWTVAIKDCNTRVMGDNGGWGLGFLRGGLKENHAALINFDHAGPGLMDGKNPYLNSVLALTLWNVTTDYEDESKYGNTTIKCRGFIKDGVFTLTDDTLTDCLLSSYQFREDMYNANETFIIHGGRFTFLVEGKKSLLNSKQIQLRKTPKGNVKVIFKTHETKNNLGQVIDVQRKVYFPADMEPHAGMVTSCGKILTKDRTSSYEWVDFVAPSDKVGMIACTVEHPLTDGEHVISIQEESFDLPEQDFYLIAKQDYNFPSTVDTKFGKDYQIMNTEPVGHLSYNHSNVTINARNVQHLGKYRQSGRGLGICNYVNLFNCEGFGFQFDPVVPVTSKDMDIPERIHNLIENKPV